MALLAQLRSCELKPFRRFGESGGPPLPGRTRTLDPSAADSERLLSPHRLSIKSSSRASVESAPTNYLFVQVESQQLDYAAPSNASIQDSDGVHPDVNVDQLELDRRNCR